MYANIDNFMGCLSIFKIFIFDVLNSFKGQVTFGIKEIKFI